MSIGEAIAHAINLDDLDDLRRTLEKLLNHRTLEILRWKQEHGLKVGFFFEVRKRGKKGIVGRVPCNGTVTKIDVPRKTVDVHVSAPVKYADKMLRIPLVWILEPFVISEKGKSLMPGLEFSE